jgi:hypothetical protein
MLDAAQISYQIGLRIYGAPTRCAAPIYQASPSARPATNPILKRDNTMRHVILAALWRAPGMLAVVALHGLNGSVRRARLREQRFAVR